MVPITQEKCLRHEGEVEYLGYDEPGLFHSVVVRPVATIVIFLSVVFRMLRQVIDDLVMLSHL